MPAQVVPNSPVLKGATLAVQAGVASRLTAPLGVALTNGLFLTVGS